MSDQPNVLFLMADDHRAQAIRACGDPCVRTPNLDGLIARGTLFEQARMVGGQQPAVCVPARACMLTGQHQPAFDIEIALRPEATTLPEALSRAGYHTFFTGKWHNGGESFVRSFADGGNIFLGGMHDHYETPVHDFDPEGAYPEENARPTGKHSSETFADAAIRCLENAPADKPFYCHAAFTAPHDPRQAPEQWRNAYDPAEVTLPANFARVHPFDNGELQIRDENLAAFPRKPDEVRQHIADYYAIISHMDQQIGRILEALERTGRAENTIVVYTADHGLSVGQHGLLGKQNLYEHSVRVPAVVAGPGVPAGWRCGALCHSHDLMPTLCDLTGIEKPEGVSAKSLAPLLRGEAAQVREEVGGVYRPLQRMITDGRWKLIRYYRDPEKPCGEDRVQLFDLWADPFEQLDLRDDPTQQDRLRDLARRLEQWQKAMGDNLAGRPALP